MDKKQSLKELYNELTIDFDSHLTKKYGDEFFNVYIPLLTTEKDDLENELLHFLDSKYYHPEYDIMETYFYNLGAKEVNKLKLPEYKYVDETLYNNLVTEITKKIFNEKNNILIKKINANESKYNKYINCIKTGIEEEVFLYYADLLVPNSKKIYTLFNISTNDITNMDDIFYTYIPFYYIGTKRFMLANNIETAISVIKNNKLINEYRSIENTILAIKIKNEEFLRDYIIENIEEYLDLKLGEIISKTVLDIYSNQYIDKLQGLYENVAIAKVIYDNLNHLLDEHPYLDNPYAFDYLSKIFEKKLNIKGRFLMSEERKKRKVFSN